jgi:plastocyanin
VLQYANVFQYVKVSSLLVAGGLTVFAVSGRGPLAGPAKAATHTVTIEGMRFDPDVLTIKAGDSVVWVNKDLFPHTATSKAGGFDSQQIAASDTWRHSFDKKGEFSYVCTLHPPMKATIKVK